MIAVMLAYFAGRSLGRAQGRREALTVSREPTASDVAAWRLLGVVMAVCALVVVLAV